MAKCSLKVKIKMSSKHSIPGRKDKARAKGLDLAKLISLVRKEKKNLSQKYLVSFL